MDKQHLNAYYPNRETMEERYFRIAQSRQRIPLKTWATVAASSFIPSFFFLVVANVSEAEVFAVFFFLCFIVFAISMAGVSVYLSGFHFLEKAELLYNTRVAGKEVVEKKESKPANSPKKAARKVILQTKQSDDSNSNNQSEMVVEEEGLVCSYCGNINLPTNKSCWACMQPLIRDL